MRAIVPLLVLSLCAPAAALAGPAASLLYERALMLEAGRRCALFSPSVTTALRAGAVQARAAAKREGQTPAVLDAIAGRAAAKARGTSCASPDLTTAAGRVRSAYEGWSRMPRMEFPGDSAAWKADKTAAGEPRWRLVQTVPLDADPLSFGLATASPHPARLTAVARFDKKRPPAFARLLADGQVFLAESREAAPKSLSPDRRDGSMAFRFSPAALAAVEKLQPEQMVTLEFVTPTRKGEQIRKARVEVGDFGVAQAFLAAR